MLLGPCVTSIPATMAALLISPLGNDRVAGKEADQDPQDGSPVHSIIKIFC